MNGLQIFEHDKQQVVTISYIDLRNSAGRKKR